MTVFQFNNLKLLTELSINKGDKDKFLVQNFFQSKHSIGSKDRKLIREYYFTYIRYKYLINYFCTNFLKKEENNPEVIIILIHNLLGNAIERRVEVNNELEGKYNSTLEHLKLTDLDSEIRAKMPELLNDFDKLKLSTDNESLSILHSTPLWIVEKLQKDYPKRYKQIVESFNKESNLSLRLPINLNRDKIVNELQANSIPYSLGNYNPCAIQISSKVDLNKLMMSKSPFFEIQDEGSQLISIYLEPQENEKILDYCSGAGGKALHIADLTGDNAEIVASDEDIIRCKELYRRSSKFGYKSIKIVKQEQLHTNYKNFFDKVLIDAPCSGSGTLKRDPHLKYKLTLEDINKRAEVQSQILNEVIPLLADGGEICYATCSIFYEENQNVITKFLAENAEFELVDVDVSTLIGGSESLHIENGLNTLPYLETDGFYMVRVKKII